MENKINGFEALTAVQREFGYKEGEIHPVAVLGLLGEAGEVMDEVRLLVNGDPDKESAAWSIYDAAIVAGATSLAKNVDKIKKVIRKNPDDAPSVILRQQDDGKAFDIELGDLLYYANLLALNRGRTLESYALKAAEKARNRSKGM